MNRKKPKRKYEIKYIDTYEGRYEPVPIAPEGTRQERNPLIVTELPGGKIQIEFFDYYYDYKYFDVKVPNKRIVFNPEGIKAIHYQIRDE